MIAAIEKVHDLFPEFTEVMFAKDIEDDGHSYACDAMQCGDCEGGFCFFCGEGIPTADLMNRDGHGEHFSRMSRVMLRSTYASTFARHIGWCALRTELAADNED